MSSRKNREIKRKLRSLRSQYKYLKSSFQDASNEIIEYESEWARDLNFIFSELDIHESCENNSNALSIQSHKNIVKECTADEKENLNNKNVPAWAKSLYKKIARKTHPDKQRTDDDAIKMSPIFQKATSAIESSSYENLFDIAIDLGISLDLDDEVLVEKMTRIILKLKNDLRSIEESIAWLWGESFGVSEIRAKIAQEVLSSKGIKPKYEKILFLIKKIESDTIEK